MHACKPSRIIVIDVVCAIHWQACSWSGCLPNEQDKMVFVGWHIGPNCEPRNEVSSSISNESVCRTIAPGVACWAMAWSRARWSRSLSQFFAQAIRASRSHRGSIHLARDGKTLRGTIPLSRNGRRACVGSLPPETWRGGRPRSDSSGPCAGNAGGPQHYRAWTLCSVSSETNVAHARRDGRLSSR
jgi:hypothetical protein